MAVKNCSAYFEKYLLSTDYVPDIVLRSEDTRTDTALKKEPTMGDSV